MLEYQQLQAARLKRLLKEQDLTQKELAERLEVSPTSVTHWVNGKVHMNDYNASLINGYFPEYSVEYLRGYSDYPNEASERRHAILAGLGQGAKLIKCVSGLVELNGVSAYWSDNYGIEICRDNETIELTSDQWDCFVKEVSAFVGMRLSLIFERGCW